jgi:DNA-damage-inducible protein J
MANANINIRTDSETKTQAQQIFSKLGLDMSTAINLFLKQSIRQRAIPFELYLDVPNDELLEAMEDVRLGRNLHGPYDTVKEAIAAMLEE